MPRNVTGGSGHKKLASKDCVKANAKTRISMDEYEYYAQVTALNGNGMCTVFCQDGKFRLCIIRGKFKGKGKRDNMLIAGTWVLVGLREFESEHDVGKENPATVSGKKDKLDKCDLLEVYKDRDKDYLKNEVNLPCFNQFIYDKHMNTGSTSNGYDEDLVMFTSGTEDAYRELMNMDLTKEQPKKITLQKKDTITTIEEDNESVEEEVNIDDI